MSIGGVSGDRIYFSAAEVNDLSQTLKRGQIAMELADAHIKLLEKRIIELEIALKVALETAHAH